LAFLISFDIDGTMEFGDPAGGVTVEMVRRAKELGFIVGSCSDRFPSWQKQVWDSHGIAVDFWVPKHMLSDVKTRFQAAVCSYRRSRHRSPARRTGRVPFLVGSRGYC
jgi:hypothetical protein